MIISIAVRTTISLLYFSPYLCNKLHLQAKVVSNDLLILLCCSLKIYSAHFYAKNIVCFVCLLLDGKSALFRLLPRLVEIEHMRYVKNDL